VRAEVCAGVTWRRCAIRSANPDLTSTRQDPAAARNRERPGNGVNALDANFWRRGRSWSLGHVTAGGSVLEAFSADSVAVIVCCTNPGVPGLGGQRLSIVGAGWQPRSGCRRPNWGGFRWRCETYAGSESPHETTTPW